MQIRMPFAKGRAKTGGRKRGVKAIRQTIRDPRSPITFSRDVRARLEQLGCDPLEGLARIALATEKSDPAIARYCYSDLASYLYAKRKAIEISGIDGGPIEINDNTALESLAARIAGIAARLGAGSGTQIAIGAGGQLDYVELATERAPEAIASRLTRG